MFPSTPDTLVAPGPASAAAPRIERLIEMLRSPSCYPHAVGPIEVIETHISYVLLAGRFAYKIRKPVQLGFLDFSTLERRHVDCVDEVRLNRRTAAQIYLEVVAIGMRPGGVRIGAGQPVEYAVKMRRFPQEALFDHIARAGALEERHVDALAQCVARLHARAPRTSMSDAYGSAELVTAQAMENFGEIESLDRSPATREILEPLRCWTQVQGESLYPVFAMRKAAGFVRECHGDSHLRNVALLDGEPVLFDCVEFGARFRWIDVMSDVAFTVMDLERHGLGRLASRFLNRYLEETGDYGGLEVLRFHAVYRAMVRAKIACIRGHQDGIGASDRAAARRDFDACLRLAERLSRRAAPALVAMCGLPASGKTTASQRLVEALGAVRLRSDVERKRLHGLDARARTHAAPGEGIYTREGSERTYALLLELARGVLAAGYSVVVDASFLDRMQREAVREVAREAGAAFEVMTCAAPEQILRKRIAARERQANDASEAAESVFERLMTAREALGDDELAHTTRLDMTREHEWRGAVESFSRRLRADPRLDSA